MDKHVRMIGETDQEFRTRIIDTPIARAARRAIYRVFDKKNKDEPTIKVYLNGDPVPFFEGEFSMNPCQEIVLLDRLEVTDIVTAGKKDE